MNRVLKMAVDFGPLFSAFADTSTPVEPSSADRRGAPTFDIVEYEPSRLFFESRLVARSRASMAQVNAVRKAIMLDVPTMAIENCLVVENTTGQHDDAIAHRLGLVPLSHTSSSSSPSDSPVGFALFARAGKEPLRVMSGHLQPLGNHGYAPFSPYLEIVKLYPGETIRMLCFAVEDTGRHHVKHIPAHAFHRRGPKPGEVDLVIECHGSYDAKWVLEQALEAAEHSFRIE